MRETIERQTGILDVREVARRGAIAVHPQRLVEDAAGNEAWYHLLEVLARPVLIERPHDDDGQVIGRVIPVHQPIRASLRARVRAHRHQRRVLIHLERPRRPVDLGRRDVNEATDLFDVLQDRVRHDLRPKYVGLEEMTIVVDGTPDVCLRRQVHDDVGLPDK